MDAIQMFCYLTLFFFLEVTCYQDCYDLNVRNLQHGSSKRRATSDTIFTFSVVSLAECAARCTYVGTCRAFFYHKNTPQCTLHSAHIVELSSTFNRNWIGYDFPDGARPTTSTSTSTNTTTTMSTTTTAPISLWVDSVIDFSSQFQTSSFSASEIVGPNDVYPTYGDIARSWAPASTSGIEWIKFQISTPVYVKEVAIYETYKAGGVKKIMAFDPEASQWKLLWSTSAVAVIPNSRIFSPPFQQTAYKTDTFLIEIDCSAADDYVELDAVKITGNP